MKRSLAILTALLFALSTHAQGIARPIRLPPESTLHTMYRSSVVATNASLGIYVLPTTRGFTVTAFVVQVGAVAVGAGNVTLRVTDGSNNCDVTAACLTTGTGGYGDTGGKRLVTSGVCTFAPGATLTASVQNAGCATTQPNFTIASIVGRWNP